MDTVLRWVRCYWEEFTYDLPEFVPGLAKPGVFYLEPLVNKRLSENGVWRAINWELGTLIDHCEEEIMAPASSIEVSQVLARMAAERPALLVQDRRWLSQLAEFLADAAKRGRTVSLDV